jgi:hypothetical protein
MSVGQTHVSAKFYVYVHCRPERMIGNQYARKELK